VNKSDWEHLMFNKKFEAVRRNAEGWPIIPISAKEGTNLDKLVELIKNLRL